MSTNDGNIIKYSLDNPAVVIGTAKIKIYLIIQAVNTYVDIDYSCSTTQNGKEECFYSTGKHYVETKSEIEIFNSTVKHEILCFESIMKPCDVAILDVFVNFK